MAKRNEFLDSLKAKAEAKASSRTSYHVEIDTMAMVLMIRDVFDCGPGRAGNAINHYLAYKLEIADEMIKELDETESKKKEIVVLRRDLAARLKEILGKENWEKYRTLFPFCQEYWEW